MTSENASPKRGVIYARISKDRTGAGLGVGKQVDDFRIPDREPWAHHRAGPAAERLVEPHDNVSGPVVGQLHRLDRGPAGPAGPVGPVDSVDRAYLRPSSTHTTCPWKGVASYYDVVVNGQANEDAAWYYPTPKEAARNIKDHVAFWRGVTIER